MRPVDPDRHEKSREARDAAWKKHEPNWRFRAPPLTFIVAWDAALDHAAQEQRNPVLGPECPKCGTIPLNLPPETGAKIRALFPELDAQEQPAPPAATTGSAREWLERDEREWPLPIHAERIVFEGCDSVTMAPDAYLALYEDATQLADRADAAEAQEKQARDGWRAAEIALDAWMAKLRNEQGLRLIALVERDDLRAQLAAAQDETRRLLELIGLASTSFSMLEAYLGPQWVEAVANMGLSGPYKIHARAALAAQKEESK